MISCKGPRSDTDFEFDFVFLSFVENRNKNIVQVDNFKQKIISFFSNFYQCVYTGYFKNFFDCD